MISGLLKAVKSRLIFLKVKGMKKYFLSIFRPQVFMVYSLINHAECWKNTRRICKSPAVGL